jgi:hypothetical protein
MKFDHEHVWKIEVEVDIHAGDGMGELAGDFTTSDLKVELGQ